MEDMKAGERPCWPQDSRIHTSALSRAALNSSAVRGGW